MSKQNLLSKKLLEEAITTDDLLGKDVIDADGVLVGITNKVFVDPKTIELLGINIDKGFLQTGLIIGSEHVQHVTKHAVFLSITPGFQLKGAHVFDVEGGLVGSIVGVALTDDYAHISSLTIKPGRFKATFDIPGSAIQKVGENVLLSVHRDEIT